AVRTVRGPRVKAAAYSPRGQATSRHEKLIAVEGPKVAEAQSRPAAPLLTPEPKKGATSRDESQTSHWCLQPSSPSRCCPPRRPRSPSRRPFSPLLPRCSLSSPAAHPTQARRPLRRRPPPIRPPLP